MKNNYFFNKMHKSVLVIFFLLLTHAFYAQVNYTYGWEIEDDMGGWEDPDFFNWFQIDEGQCAGDYSLVTNLYFWTSESEIYSPNIGSSIGGEIECSFDYKVVDYYDETGVSGNVFSITFAWSNNPSGPWTTFHTINSSNHVVSDDCAVATANFTPGEGNVYIRIKTELADMFGDDDILIYIDDLQITEGVSTITCPTPGGLSVSNTTLNAAQLNWTSTGTQFSVEWGESGFTHGNGTLETDVIENNLTIEGLEEDTMYEFYVKNICDDDDESNWSGPYAFYIGYCISEPTSVDGNGITSLTMGTETFTLNSDTYHDLMDTVVDIDPSIPVNSSVTLNTDDFGFWGYSYDFNIWIDFNKDGIFDNATELVFQGTSDDDSTTTLNTTFDISDQTGLSGEYRLRIGAIESGEQQGPNPCYNDDYGVTVDMIVRFPFNCDTPTDLEVIANVSFAELSWTATGTLYEIEWGPAGFTQGNGTIVSEVANPYILEGLDPDTEYDFYVRQLCATAQSEWSASASFTTLCATEEAIVEAQTFCTTINTTDIEITIIPGQTVQWYSSLNAPSAINAISESGIYYVQTSLGECLSEKIPVEITIIGNTAPNAEATQVFCNAASVNDLLVAPQAGSEIRWYTSATATQALNPSTALVNETIYYASYYHIASACESNRVAVQAIITQTPMPITSQTISLCQETPVGQISLNALSGATLNWYATASSQQPLSTATMATTGTYYVTQSIGACESDRVAVTISLYANLQKPNATTQNICGSGTVADLVATGAVNGAEYRWYTSLQSQQPLNATAALISGVYYVSQTLGGCESTRRSVSVRVIPQTAPVINAFVLCGASTVADLYLPTANNISYKWYTSTTATTELTQNTILTTGTYYAERVEYGCISARTAVSVTISDIPSSPTGALQQSFTVNTIGQATIADLIMDQTDIYWYNTYNDARNDYNPLPAETPLVNGKTYYAAIIGSNGCSSLPTAVLVDVTLGMADFDKTQLAYYPNPTTDILNIQYKQTIDSVTVYNLAGQKVLAKTYNSDKIQLDMSSLASGNYLLELRSQNQSQIIKISKK